MYYISSGLGNGMYTLREQYHIKTNYGIQLKDSYIKNLARDFGKACTKAEQHMKDYDGDVDKLVVGTEFELNAWGDADRNFYVAPELTPEEIAKREAEAKAKAEKDAEWAEYQRQLRQASQEKYDKADPVPVTDDRIKFTGVIEKTYHKDNQWGGQWRMFFVDDRGFKLNGSAIKETYIDEDGDEEVRFFKDEARVSFVAKVTPSDDDPKFGFFKRPNKVEVL